MVLLFGGLAVVVVAMCSVPGGLPAIIGMGQEESKFSMGEMRFDWTSRTVPTVLVYGFTSLIGQNLSYQVQESPPLPPNTHWRYVIDHRITPSTDLSHSLWQAGGSKHYHVLRKLAHPRTHVCG